MSPTDKPERPKAQSRVVRKPLERALEVLNWMVDAPGTQWGVREVARGLDLTPSTAHRILHGLAEQGFVSIDAATGRMSLGSEFFRMATKGAARFPFREAAMPALRGLVALHDETAWLTTYEARRRQIMMIASVESSHQLRTVVRLSEWLPPYYGASGLSVVAFLPADERETIIEQFQRDHAGHDDVSSEVTLLRKSLERARQTGYSRTVGERTPGALGIAAPVFGLGDQVMGSIGISMALPRFVLDTEPIVAESVINHAANVSAALRGERIELEVATPPASPQPKRLGSVTDGVV